MNAQGDVARSRRAGRGDREAGNLLGENGHELIAELHFRKSAVGVGPILGYSNCGGDLRHSTCFSATS